MKLFKISILIIFVGLTGGCTKDFSDVNTNKNNPTGVTPDLLLSGIIRSMMDRQVNEAWGIGNIVVQHHSKIQFVNEDRYGWNEKNDIWNTVYSNYRNLQNIFTATGENTSNPYYGVGLILKSWMFSQVTDAYGDVPYSEAGKAKIAGVYQPGYDKQEDIYTGILADLKKANEVLTTAGTSLSGDVLYGGGASSLIKWRKLANSLRLRYLMRISKKKNVNADMQAIISNAANNPIFESNAENAELKYFSAAPNQWPMYGSRVGSFDEFRVSKTLTDRLTALNDPRIKVFGRPTQASVAAGTPVIQGAPNGLSDVDALAYNGGVQGVSRVGYTFACLVCNDPNQAPPDPAAPRALIMTYAELQFILAEARQKGMITTGDAATYYNNGITANFSYWQFVVPSSYNLDITMPVDYLTQTAVVYSGTDEEKLAKIALQKWIALYFNGLEAWFDWRRTNMPAIIPGPANLNNNKVPVRYIYPLSEQSLNSENRKAAVQRQANTDDLNTKMWLLQ
jgi:hypothetical protein